MTLAKAAYKEGPLGPVGPMTNGSDGPMGPARPIGPTGPQGLKLTVRTGQSVHRDKLELQALAVQPDPPGADGRTGADGAPVSFSP